MSPRSPDARTPHPSHPQRDARAHSAKTQGPWTRRKVGPTAYVYFRPLAPSVMDRMPRTTKRFTEASTFDVIARRIYNLIRSLVGPAKQDRPDPESTP